MIKEQLHQLIAELTTSVQDFHDRFGLVGEATQQELISRIPIQDEEVIELHHAILNESPDRVANEAVDVLYVAIGTLLRLDPEFVASALAEVIEKNNTKTHDTHHVNQAGKVVRKT